MKYKALLFTVYLYTVIISACQEQRILSFNNNQSKSQKNYFCKRQIKIARRYTKEAIGTASMILAGWSIEKILRYCLSNGLTNNTVSPQISENSPDTTSGLARPLHDNLPASPSNADGCATVQNRTTQEIRTPFSLMIDHLPRDLAQIAEEYRTPTTVTITTTRDAYSSIPVEVDDNNDTQGRLISLDNRQIYPAKIIEAIDSFYAHTNSPCIQVSSRGLLLAERAANGTITGARNIQYRFLDNYPHVDIFVGNPGEELKRRI